MRKLSRKAGITGIVLASFGVLGVLAGGFLLSADTLVQLSVMFGFMTLYLVGGLLTTGAFGYRRGTKVFLFLFSMRLVIIAAFLLSISKMVSGR